MQSGQDDNRPHILIVGAGIAGLSLAYELSKHPITVTVLDSAEAKASDVPVALLNPHRGRTAKATELDRAGLAAMQNLADELEAEGLAPGINFTGVLRLPSSARQAKLWQKQSALRWLPKAPQGFHAPYGAALVPNGGWLEPALLLKSLKHLAQYRGATFQRATVVAVKDQGRSELVLSDIGEFTADKVILCVGARTHIDLSRIDLRHYTGDVIELDLKDRLVYPLAGAVYGAQSGNSLFMGGNHRESFKDAEAVPRLKRAASWFIPAVKDASLVSQWSGTRTKQSNNQPLIKPLRKHLWFYGALAGRGFLCAAYLSRRLAAQLLEPHDSRTRLVSSQAHLPSDL